MIIQIFQVLLLASASALCIALVIYLSRITKSFESIQADISRMADEIHPMLQSLDTLTQSVNNITSYVKEQIDSIAWIVDTVKSRVEALLDLEKKIREGIETPVQNLTTNLTAVKKGIAAFVHRLKF